MNPTISVRPVLALCCVIAASVGCGSDETSIDAPATAEDASTDPLPADAGTDASEDRGSGGSAGSPPVDAGADALDDGGEPQLDAQPDATTPPADPALDGPFAYAEVDGSMGAVSVHCAVPTTGPTPAPYPLVLFAHGFLIESFRYYDYIKRLGTFGYVACTVDYSSLGTQDQDPVAMVGALDWALSESSQPSGDLAGKVDGSLVGVMGHSRGGKAAVNAAASDARFRAVLGLDPVNTCPIGTCPDGIEAMATLSIPSGFLGETTDNGQGGGLGQACAPADDNFEKFYDAAGSPSFRVNVLGANHMSFVDDTTGCLQCGMCKAATADGAAVLDLSHAYTVAFFERRLRGIEAYETYLTGELAQQRYVQTGQAEVVSK